MPDTVTPSSVALSPAERIERERLPLPSHDLVGVNFRAWALAVCKAEVEHRNRDFWRCAYALGISDCFDKFMWGNCEETSQFKHEAYAGFALSTLTSLQVHDSRRRGPWSSWEIKTLDEKRDWLRRRRVILGCFIREVHRYKAARAAHDAEQTITVTTAAPAPMEAA